MADMDVSDGFDVGTFIGFGILGFVFTIGMCLQIKTIKVLKQDRATAWEIDLSHSIVMMIHYSFVLVFHDASQNLEVDKDLLLNRLIFPAHVKERLLSAILCRA